MKTGFTDVVKTPLGKTTEASIRVRIATILGSRRTLGAAALLALVLAVACVAPARAEELKPYKDGLFADPRVQQSGDGGAYRVDD